MVKAKRDEHLGSEEFVVGEASDLLNHHRKDNVAGVAVGIPLAWGKVEGETGDEFDELLAGASDWDVGAFKIIEVVLDSRGCGEKVANGDPAPRRG
jgi:hypothetical protein